MAELVVSVGILVLMLAVAGEVLRLTVNTTGQARGLTQINQQLRVFEQMLREDLDAMNPDEDRRFMLIQGNTINAHWTEDGKDADENERADDGYLHAADPERTDPQDPTKLALPRADVLMFFIDRSDVSNVHAGRSPRGPQQIVYGHANLGEYEADDTQDDPWTYTNRWTFPDDADEPFGLAAEFWHLARRNVLLPKHVAVTPLDNPPVTRLDDPRILQGETDVFEGFDMEAMVLDPGAKTDNNYAAGTFPTYLPLIFRAPGGAQTLIATPHARCELDEDPPPTVSTGVNHYFLPKCASFKVEWALDPGDARGLLDGESEVFWFDPGALAIGNANPEPLQTLYDATYPPNGPENIDLEKLRIDPLFGQGAEAYTLEERFNGPDGDPTWREEVPDNLVVFTATRPKPGTAELPGVTFPPDDIFPGALRITIDVFDTQRRLQRPIRHVIVVPVGKR